ncbi:MAG TPA: DUF1573 domain-containing protein [Bacteroidia bacterium]|nr:DUF1573 domain-containing protein [Bacteroidia bacterium]
MKKVMLPLAFALFTVIGMSAQTAPAPAAPATPAPNPNGPTFKFEEEEFNFGKLEQGKSVSHDFKFKNVGKEPMVISDATATCGCTKPSFAKDPIKPGGSGVISVTFNSTGKMGAQDKAITITSNAKEGQKVIHLKGEVEPKPAAPAAPATQPNQPK